MRTLIVQLPLGMPTPSTTYAHALLAANTPSGAPSLQWAAASLLPSADRQTEVVALVPAQALSWHRVELPSGLHKQTGRLQAALQGLLEERLLNDPTQLHMALAPDWMRNPKPWVAVCDRAWLGSHLQALEAAGLTVHRIVPELAPTPGPLNLHALGDAEHGWLWCSQAERGVWGLPLHAVPPEGEGLWSTEDERTQTALLAEPAMVAAASQRLGMQAQLMAPAQHWIRALDSGWDLAQFEWQANTHSRWLKTWQRAASQFWHHRSWRPARWGLWLLLASQLLGFNAWAWKTRAHWQAQQHSWTQLLQETFPQVRVVVDAPVQMAQEVNRLRQGNGQLAAHDLEAMLAALGQAMPAGLTAPRQWQYQPGQLQLQDFKLSTTEQDRLSQALSAQGYLWRADGNTWRMSVREKQP